MSLLAVVAVVLIAVSMRIYLAENDNDYDSRLQEQVKTRMSELARNPQQNADQLWQLFRDHYNIEDFLPGIPDSIWRVLAKMVAFTIPLIIIAGLLTSRSISRQFSVLSAAVRKVRDGDFSVDLVTKPQAPRELTELTENFNDMAQRLGQYERELGESSAMLAHELRTPLNAAMSRLQAMLDEVFPFEPDQLRSVHAQLEQINRLVDDLNLVSLARAGQLTLNVHSYDACALLAERIEWAAVSLQQAGIAVNLATVQPIEVYGDRDRIGQCISILIDNVIRYAADGKV